MKKIILISIAFLFALSIFAQSPNMFNYQAVVRSPTGDLLKNQSVSFEIVILQTSPTGTPVYTETHNATTNEYGLVTLKIGDGTTSDDLSTIDWGADDFYMKVSMDEEGGTNYQVMGTTQLLSVPYSLYSEAAENVADNSISSEKILDGEVSDNDISFNYAGSSSKGGPATSIANNTVTSVKIQDGEVQADDLADGTALAEILDDDGTGSGLDADMLDGESRSYYRNASNIDAGTLSTTRYSSYQDLFAENRIAEITGTTHASLAYVDFVLPGGWTITNTRVVSVEIYRSGSYWSGISYTTSTSDMGIRYFMWNNSSTPTLRIQYPGNTAYQNRSIRILMIRVD